MLKTNISYLNGLRNQEFPDALATIITILESGVIAEEYVIECLEIVKAEKDKLGLLKDRRKGNPLSSVLYELNYNRNDYISSFRGRINYSLKSPIETERKAAKVLNVWLNRYSDYLYTPRIHEQNTLVDQLADDMETNTKLADAMTDAGLINVLDSIKMITREIRSVFKERSAYTEGQKRKTNELRRNAYDALKMLLNALEIAIKLNPENRDAYVGYWNEVSRVLDRFNAKVQSRSTRRKNAEEQNEETPVEDVVVDGDDMDDEVEGDTEMTPPTPKTTTAMRSRPYNVLRLNESMDMDLQTVEKAHEDWDATNDAMNGSGTINNNDVTTTNGSDTAKADDATADNKAMDDAATDNSEQTSSAEETSPAESDTKAHDGATSEDLNN